MAQPLPSVRLCQGANENPPVATPATGFTTVSFDTTTNLLTIDLTFTGLSKPTVAAHIHCCTSPPENAPVATTAPAFPNFQLENVASAEAVFVAGFENGMTYLNIHTTQNRGGEIRAVLTATPEPASDALVGLALAGLWMLRRRAGRLRQVTNK